MSHVTFTELEEKQSGDELTAVEVNKINTKVNLLLEDIVSNAITPSKRLLAGLSTGSLYVINLQAG
tara:strand:+ start:198 stop:395 length:198 start_codon:yes stop_codon:yes gene_type:complete